MGLVVSGVGQCALVPNFHYNAPNATLFTSNYTVESRTQQEREKCRKGAPCVVNG